MHNDKILSIANTAQKKAIKHYLPMMDETFILIVDDWNWDNVRVPTLESIKKMVYKVLYKEEITGKIEDSTDYWNGLGIFVLEKNRKMFGIGQ